MSSGSCELLHRGGPAHRRVRPQAQLLVLVRHEQAAPLEQAVGRLFVTHIDLDGLAAHLHAEAQPLPAGGEPGPEANLAV